MLFWDSTSQKQPKTSEELLALKCVGLSNQIIHTWKPIFSLTLFLTGREVNYPLLLLLPKTKN